MRRDSGSARFSAAGLVAEIVLLHKLLLQLELLLLLLLLLLLQLLQHLLRRSGLPIGLQPIRRQPWLWLTHHARGVRCQRLPGYGRAWLIRRGGLAVGRLVGGFVFVAIRRRRRRRSWSSHRNRSTRLFAGVLPYGQHNPSDGLLLRTKQNVVIARAI